MGGGGVGADCRQAAQKRKNLKFLNLFALGRPLLIAVWFWSRRHCVHSPLVSLVHAHGGKV